MLQEYLIEPNRRILVVYDASAFGAQIADLRAFFDKWKFNSISVLDWESFEWYILKSKVFNEVYTLKDVDQSDVVSAYAIKSPILGMIAPTMISGGVKALILMLKENFIIWGTACGDNCSKWIIEIAKQKDFTICLEHVMNFPEEFEPVRILNNDHIVTTDKDMFREAIRLVHS